MQFRLRLLRLWRWLLLVPAVGCLACSGGGGLHPVQGKVLKGNQPAKGVVVTFHPAGADPITAIRPVGVTNEEGEFTLTTGDKPGAAAGEYTVTMIWPEEVKKSKGISTEPPDSRDRLQGAYADATKSRFKKVEVKSGLNQLEPFQLK
jgi:hypothetical protein